MVSLTLTCFFDLVVLLTALLSNVTLRGRWGISSVLVTMGRSEGAIGGDDSDVRMGVEGVATKMG